MGYLPLVFGLMFGLIIVGCNKNEESYSQMSDGRCSQNFIDDYNRVQSALGNLDSAKVACNDFFSKNEGVSCTARLITEFSSRTVSANDLRASCSRATETPSDSDNESKDRKAESSRLFNPNRPLCTHEFNAETEAFYENLKRQQEMIQTNDPHLLAQLRRTNQVCASLLARHESVKCYPSAAAQTPVDLEGPKKVCQSTEELERTLSLVESLKRPR